MYEYAATVLDVIDGDTVRLRVDLGFALFKHDVFRLAGINAPELRGPTAAAGQAAREALMTLIGTAPGLLVRTVRDRQEKYGRYLAVLVRDGASINQALVDQGHAEPREY